MAAPDAILELVERFTYNLDAYRSTQYNETRLRREFLDPFFTQLGWDVDNRQGYAEAYKDVIHEDAIKIGGATKAPDYCFRIGGTRKFFVEAKKPAINLKDDSSPAFQLRRYAWSAKLPLSILTDFEEFAIYDCRIQPNQSDKAAIARLLYIPYQDYLSRWDEIAAIFSRDAILKGAFDKYADDKKSRRGTAEVDAAFLGEIEKWREALAQNLARRNPELKNRELNFAVQITIDRIIFLRICEDRGIETLGRLQALLNGGDVYGRLCQLFREADDRYNSGLFHFRLEKGRDDEGLDTLTPRLKIDDKVLKEILVSLYYPSPYAFDVFPADILGQVYEQFLGKVIRLTPKHQAIIEDKPEVKKAGGVYYTPTYIVNYIVEQTVGKLLEGKTPKQVATLRFLDPACGSGSFLIAAYQKLLDWHQKWYFENGPEKHAKGKTPELYQGMGGAWRLTASERKRILLANIYGVDIDAQAVEVTKLSLLLKVLEGETEESVRAQLSLVLGSGRVLPDLDANIQCGNSLIGPDFYDGKQTTLFDEEEMYRVNAFDWKKQFPAILSGDNPGFDAVIGNPPYLGGREWKEESGRQYDYFMQKFSVAEYQFDIYALFWQQGIELLKLDGFIGYITPNTWLNNKGCIKLRDYILKHTAVESITDYARIKVFTKATVLPIVTILRRSFSTSNKAKIYLPTGNTISFTHEIPQSQWEADTQKIFNIALHEGDVELRARIEEASVSLLSLAQVKFGIKIYETGKGIPAQTPDDAKLHVYEATTQISLDYRRYLEGKDIQRYQLNWQSRWLKYGKNLAAPRDPSLFTDERLLVRRIVGERLIGTYISSDEVTSQLLQIVKPYDSRLTKYLLGVLNSSLIAFYFRKKYNRSDKTFPEIRIYELEAMPIRVVNFDDPSGKNKYDRMVTLVETMLHLNQQLPNAVPTTRTVLQRQIEATDHQIDQLVYQLYGLTADEIALVEQGTN